MAPLTIGVVGLGLMGGGMAARLVERGHAVSGYDPDPHARRRAAGAGVRVCGSVAAVSAADHVLTSLPTSELVREVWLGRDGLMAHARPGCCLIEVSTIDPQTMRDLSAARRERVAVVDAPVSGGPPQARAGTLTFIVGGTDTDVRRARPVLAELAGVVHHAGPVGAGKVVKLINNVMSMTNTLVAAEAFALGAAAGVEPQRLYDILSVSGGSSAQFVKRFPDAIAGNFEPGFTMALGAKDLTLALDLARSTGSPVPMTAAARELYALAMNLGYATKDMVAFVDLFRRWSCSRGCDV